MPDSSLTTTGSFNFNLVLWKKNLLKKIKILHPWIFVGLGKATGNKPHQKEEAINAPILDDSTNVPICYGNVVFPRCNIQWVKNGKIVPPINNGVAR